VCGEDGHIQGVYAGHPACKPVGRLFDKQVEVIVFKTRPNG